MPNFKAIKDKLNDIVADFLTSNDPSTLNDKINQFKEAKNLVEDANQFTKDIESNKKLGKLRSEILNRVKQTFNTEQIIQLEKKLTTEFLKDLIKILLEDSTSENQNTEEQHDIFDLSQQNSVNFDVRYKLCELLDDIQNEAITNETPHLFERILSSITKNNTRNLEFIGEEIYPGIKINPRAYLHYHFIVKMLENNEGEVSIPINETLMNEASLKTFFENHRLISAGIDLEYIDPKEDKVFQSLSVGVKAHDSFYTDLRCDHDYEKVIVKFQTNSHIALSGEQAYREYKTKIHNDIQSNKKNYNLDIKFLKQIKPLFDDHRLANLLKVDSPTEMSNTISDIESLKDAKIKLDSNLSYKFLKNENIPEFVRKNGILQVVNEQVTVEYIDRKNKLNDIISFSKLSDDDYLDLYKLSSNSKDIKKGSKINPYHRELFKLYESQLAKKVEPIKVLKKEQAEKAAAEKREEAKKAEVMKVEREQKQQIAFIRENTPKALTYLNNYLSNQLNDQFRYDYSDYGDTNHDEREIILNIDHYSELYQNQDEIHEKIVKIKDLMSSLPLKYIDFKYDRRAYDYGYKHNDAIDYVKAKRLKNGQKIHYKSISKLNEYLKNKFNDRQQDISSQYNRKKITNREDYDYVAGYRRNTHISLPFFPIGITASSLLTIFSIVPASITTPINIIILCTAAILSVYIMLLPESLPSKTDDALSSRLKHLGIFCLLNAIAITIFHYFLPALAVTILISLLPTFANTYKGILLDSKRSAIDNLVKYEQLSKNDYLQGELKGCSLFKTNYRDEVVLNTSINLALE